MQDRNVQFPQRYKLKKVAGTDDIYDLIPTPGEISSEGTFLNKANLLKDVTASIFGLGSEAVPDDVFAWLGQYNQHWWARTAQNLVTKYRYRQTQEGGQITVYFSKILCSDAVTLNEDTGEIALVNPIVPTSYSEFKSHPYCKSTGQGVYINAAGTTSYNETNIFYCPNNPSHSASNLVRFDSNVPVYKLVVESYQINAGDTEFVHSANRNAYPDSGISDGFEYAYLGIPFDNAVTAPKIETGSYVGTGTSSEYNPVSLTFDFEPKLVIVTTTSGYPYEHYGWLEMFMWSHGVTQLMMNTVVIQITLKDNQLSWYTSSSPTGPLNSSGTTYYYTAIG